MEDRQAAAEELAKPTNFGKHFTIHYLATEYFPVLVGSDKEETSPEQES